MSKTNSNENSKGDSPKEIPKSNTSANAKEIMSPGIPMPASAQRQRKGIKIKVSNPSIINQINSGKRANIFSLGINGQGP